MAPVKADRSHSRGLGLSLHEVVQRFAAPDVDALNPGIRAEFSRHLTGKHKQETNVPQPGKSSTAGRVRGECKVSAERMERGGRAEEHDEGEHGQGPTTPVV